MASTTTTTVQQRHPMYAQLEYAVNRSPIPLRIEQVRDASPSPRQPDRFSVFVPCCLDHLKWEILYNSQYPSLPPDFIFGPEDEDFQPLAPPHDESSSSKGAWSILLDWNVKDPARLLRLIIELRNLYLRYQRARVEAVDDPRVRFEISTIGGIEGLEMRYVPGYDKQAEVVMCLPLLKVDLRRFSRPSGILAESSIFLQVRFIVQGESSASSAPSQIRLYAPPDVRELFDTDSFRVPGWPEGTCLAGYYPQVQDMLKQQVQEAFDAVTVRKSFMEALPVFFGRPVEADTTFFRRVTLLSSSGVFTFLIHVHMPINFPKQQPTFFFQSSQHFDAKSRPIFSKPYNEYPWSPRWDVNEKCQRLLDFVTEECLVFKKQCGESVMQPQR